MNSLSGHGLFAAAALLVAGLVYLPHLDAYFIKDDLSLGILLDERGAFNHRGFLHQLLWPSERTWDDIWRPVPAISWALDAVLFGPDPFAFHVVGVLLHAFNAILVYFLVHRLLGFRHPLAARAGAMLFLLYPIQGEAVMWSTQRTVVMGLSFCLLSLLSYDAWLHRRRKGLFLLAFAMMALGTLSREHALTVPASFAVLSLVAGPPRPLLARIRETAWTAAAAGVFYALYFGARLAIFGRFAGGYSGWPTQEAYRKDLQVIERLPETIQTCLAPANRAILGGPVFESVPSATPAMLFAALQAALPVLALLNVLRARDRGMYGKLVLLALVFSVAAWLPVWQVFYVERNLLNSRSGYHLTALLAAALGAGLGLGGARAGRPGRPALAAIGLAAISYGAVLAANLSAYGGGGRQVRRIQQDSVQAVHALESPWILALEVPREFRGCPTIDAYLPDLLAPPFTTRRIPALPLVAGRERGAAAIAFLANPEPSGYGRLRERLGAGGLEFLRCFGNPPSARSVFPRNAPEESRGGFGIFPADGEVMVQDAEGGALALVPPAGAGLRAALAASGIAAEAEVTAAADTGAGRQVRSATLWRLREMVFACRDAEGASAGRLWIQAPGREMSLPFVVGAQALRTEGAILYRVSAGVSQPGATPLPWPLPPEFYNPVVAVLWRMDLFDDAGETVHSTRPARLLLLDGR